MFDTPVLDAAGKLGKIVVGMNKALGEIPVTVKLRTGVKEGRNNAHKIMPRLSTEWGAGAITVSFMFDRMHRLLNPPSCSYTAEPDNSGIPSSLTGTTSGNASKLYGLARLRKTLLPCLYSVEATSFHHKTTGRNSSRVMLTGS